MQNILAARARDGEFVFGARNGRPFNGWGSSKAVLDRRISATGAELEHWTQHDLRRTMATWLAESGTAPHIVEAILNHVGGHKGGVAGIYNRATYEPQKRAALDRWGNHIETLIDGKRSADIIRLWSINSAARSGRTDRRMRAFRTTTRLVLIRPSVVFWVGFWHNRGLCHLVD